MKLKKNTFYFKKVHCEKSVLHTHENLDYFQSNQSANDALHIRLLVELLKKCIIY